MDEIFSDAFYESEQWRDLRYRALVHHGGKCQACGATGHEKVLHVDHIKPRSKFPELALKLSNLQVLCVDCNLGKSNRDSTDWRPKPKKKRQLTKTEQLAYLERVKKGIE